LTKGRMVRVRTEIGRFRHIGGRAPTFGPAFLNTALLCFRTTYKEFLQRPITMYLIKFNRFVERLVGSQVPYRVSHAQVRLVGSACHFALTMPKGGLTDTSTSRKDSEQAMMCLIIVQVIDKVEFQRFLPMVTIVYSISTLHEPRRRNMMECDLCKGSPPESSIRALFPSGTDPRSSKLSPGETESVTTSGGIRYEWPGVCA